MNYELKFSYSAYDLMEQVPLENYIEQLESLDYNPIIGSKPMSQDGAKLQPKTKIPTLSHIIKPQFESATSRASSLNPGPGTPSLRKKRTH